MSNLRQVRKQAGLTQIQLAKRAKVTQSMVSLWEKGHQEMTLSNLRKVAKALKVEPAQLL